MHDATEDGNGTKTEAMPMTMMVRAQPAQWRAVTGARMVTALLETAEDVVGFVGPSVVGEGFCACPRQGEACVYASEQEARAYVETFIQDPDPESDGEF